MEEKNKSGRINFAAMKAGMNRRTAAKYWEAGKLPSELPPKDRTWRTRPDPFEEHWPEIEERLEDAPELEAKILFEYLCYKYSGQYQEGQLRTLQRRVKRWRATKGPDKEVFFAQKYQPGKLMETDFTFLNSLGVMIRGEPFPHMLCHCVLPYSNWEWGRICFSESYEAIKLGVQSALVRLGRVPMKHRTDGTTAATHQLAKGEVGKRPFNENYKELMDHFGMEPETVCDPNHQADVEALNGALKRRLKQHLALRRSRDFESRKVYESFLFGVMDKANGLRTKRLAEEMAVMKELPVTRLPLYSEIDKGVSVWSTIRVKKNTYSVPSRLKGERVKVRIFVDHIQVLYADRVQLDVERLKGESGHRIDYRHVIWSLVRKPYAFANYWYREEMFPTEVFRRAYDALKTWLTPFRADSEYLRILYLAATTMESEVETALTLLLEYGRPFRLEQVKDLVCQYKPDVPEMEVPCVDLSEYDSLLNEKEAIS